ncbi:MAG: exonuclease [Chloroflexi bacterium]|nr:exonuclease [Chloroflexota bacterium]
MVTITCYGGVGQIGGNQFLLEDGETRLFFDFGTPYAQWNRYYEEYMKPRPAAGLLDPLVMGLVPPLEGVYRQDLEGHEPELWRRVRERPGYRLLDGAHGVLLSHAHLDHSGYISFLRPEVPVYASAMTALIAKATQDIGDDFEKEVCYFRPRELGNEGALVAARKADLTPRPFAFVDARELPEEARGFLEQSPLTSRKLTAPSAVVQSDRVGALRLRALSVDHSIYGATAYAVETSAGWVAFTGDIRLDWAPDAKTRALVDALRALRPRALLCEGTRAGETGHTVTEDSVAQRALEEVRRARGLVIADFGPRNIRRLETFLAVARATGRKLVITAKDAYLLDAMASLQPSIPSATHPDIFIYRQLKSRPDTWERDVRKRHESKLVGAEEVRGALDSLVLCFSYWDLKELVDVDPRGGLYVYSSSEAHSEDQQMDLRRLRNWLGHFGIASAGLPVEVPEGKFQIPEGELGLHASGHSTGEDIIHLVNEIAPRTVIPVHTERPGWFTESLGGTAVEVMEPGYGRPMVLG